MLLSKGFLVDLRYLLARMVFFLFGDPQRGPGGRLNLVTQKANDQNNQGNSGAASCMRG